MIPLRATDVKYSSEWPKHIVLHHTAEFVENVPRFQFDVRKPQALDYMAYSKKVLKQRETKYHFIIDRQGPDFGVMVSQPLLTMCVYDDLPPEFAKAVHIAFLGDYNNDIPPTRIYRVLAYRLLSPLMRLFYLDEEDILLHSAISTEEGVTCPGEFIDMTKVKNSLREVRRKRAVKRG